MKYKPGDKVKIKSLDWFKANEYVGQGLDDVRAFLEMMYECCGKELTIDFISTDERGTGYIMKEVNTQWRFTDSMIEGLVNKSKMVSLEKVKNWLELNTDWNKEYISEDSPKTCWYRNVRNPNYGKIDELVKYLEE